VSDIIDRRRFLQVAGMGAGLAGVLQGAGESTLIDNPRGGFRFRKGGNRFSSGGTVAMHDYEIVHAAFSTALPVAKAFEAVDSFLKHERRPPQALCGVELRSPHAFSFTEFGKLNQGYMDLIAKRDLLVEDANPVARVNVVPELDPPRELAMYGFSYTAPRRAAPPTFLLAASDLNGEYPRGIVARGDVSTKGLQQKLQQVLDSLDKNLGELGAEWSQATVVALYTVHDVFPLMREVLLPRVASSKNFGIRWYFCRPPIEELELEIQVRGCARELII